jgi:hypothetical protein
MKLERSDIEFAVWRKKVDKSLFEHNGTTVPEWACRMWGLQEMYGQITSRKDPRSKTLIRYKNAEYEAWVAERFKISRNWVRLLAYRAGIGRSGNGSSVCGRDERGRLVSVSV